MDVLKNIIIPRFAKITFSNNKNTIISKLIFNFYESLGILFLERYKEYESKTTFTKKISISFSKKSFEQYEVETVDQFKNFILNEIDKDEKLQFSFGQKQFNLQNILDIIEKNSTSIDILIFSSIWSIFNSDMFLFLKSIELESSFLSKGNIQGSTFQILEKLNSKNPSFDQDLFVQSIDLNERLQQSYIECINHRQTDESLPKQCSMACFPNYLLAFSQFNDEQNQPKNLLKINVCSYIVSKNAVFENISCPIQNDKDEFQLLSVGNDAIIYDTQGNIYMYESIQNGIENLIPIKQTFFSRLSPPFASDGKFIYSILNSKEIGVFELDKSKYSISIIKRIRYNDNNKINIDPKFKFTNNLSLITNGIVLEIIKTGNYENSKVTHFARVISLINGSHIKDFLFQLPFPIHSISFDPFTRKIWTMSLQHKIMFTQFNYTGPDPPWLANLNEIQMIRYPKLTNFQEHTNLVIDYVHSSISLISGCEFDHETRIPDFIKSSINTETINLILNMLSNQCENIKFTQTLFILLEFQIKFQKIDHNQMNALIKIIQKYLKLEYLYNFLVLFVVHITPFIKSNAVSKLFDLVIDNFNENLISIEYLFSLFARIEKTKKFPYIFENTLQIVFFDTMVQIANETVTDSNFNFLMSYQTKLFHNYSRIYHSNIEKIDKIDKIIIEYVSFVICRCITFIQNLKSLESFECSKLIVVVKKLLMDLRLTSESSTLSLSLLPIILELLKEIPKSNLFSNDGNNQLYQFCMNVFGLYSYGFKKLLSISDLDNLKKNFRFINNEIKQEATIQEIFHNLINVDDLTEVINIIYSKVSNPLNKRLTKEEKEFEKFLFVVIIYKVQETNEIIELSKKIKANENIQIAKLIRSIIQSIYSIRTKFHFIKQNGNTNDYMKMKNKYMGKASYLLQFNSDKFSLKEIIDFLNDNSQINEIIQEKMKLDSTKRNFELFIPMINSFISQNIPNSLVYLLIMNIFDNSDIISTYELIKDTVKVDLKSVDLIIKNVLMRHEDIPFNIILSFICDLLLLLTMSYHPNEIHNIIYESMLKMVTLLCSKSINIEKREFKSCISIISHFNRILNNEKLYEITQKEKEMILMQFQNIDLKIGMSYTITHLLYQGLFKSSVNLELIKPIIGLVDQSKFHYISLLLYDSLYEYSKNENEKEFLALLTDILDIIGSVLSGSYSKKLLQIAVPISEIEKSPQSAFIRTPASQMACILDLVQIIRKLIALKGFNSSKIIFKYFKHLSENLQLDNQKYMKQLFGMFGIMTNIIEVLRPYSIVRTLENKSYLVLSIDESSNNIEGLLLPVMKNQIIKHKLKTSTCLKSYEMIQYSLSLFKEYEMPYSLFKKAIKMDKEKSSDWLFSFFALQCVKESILDPKHGKDFSDILFSRIKIKSMQKFMFTDSSSNIISFLKKSLEIPNKGVFSISPQKHQFYHAPFTQIVLNNDYLISDNEFNAKTCPHVFLSSILTDSDPSYLCFKYENIYQFFNFGITTHSIDNNKSISIYYSSKTAKFYINGEPKVNYKLEINTSIECCYMHSKNIVSFANSKDNSILFSCNLGSKYQCSFFALIYPGTHINYYCNFKPQTDYFLRQSNDQQFTIDNKKIFQLESKIYTEQFEKIVSYSNKLKKLTLKKDDIILHPNVDETSLFDISMDFHIPETNHFMAHYVNAYCSSSMNTYTSPIQLNNYLQVNEVSGKYSQIPLDYSMIESIGIIPEFNIFKYHNIPSELINHYICESCKNHMQEIYTLLTVRFLNNSYDMNKFVNQICGIKSIAINCITSILLLLEPINQLNLKSPINFSTFNGFENCVKTDLYDYFGALTKLIKYFDENEKEKFISKWFKKLKKDFQNKYMHFCSQKNKKAIVTKLGNNTYQTYNDDDATGWIVFPIKFGLYGSLDIVVNDLIINNSNAKNVNYLYWDSKLLKIKRNYENYGDNDILYCILPFYNKSNESLFYTFYQLIVSFKYFVLFSKNDLSSRMKYKLWKLVLNSIIAGSPFFYSHLEEILLFLMNNIQIDFSPESISMLSAFSITNTVIKSDIIRKFIYKQHFLINESNAKAFANDVFNGDKYPQNYDRIFPLIPRDIDYSINKELLSFYVSSAMFFENSNDSSFPYHFFFQEWIESILCYAPYDLLIIEPNIVSITFKLFVPKQFEIYYPEISPLFQVEVSQSRDFDSVKIYNASEIAAEINYQSSYIPISPDINSTYYVRFPNINVSQYKFTVRSFNFLSLAEKERFIYFYKNVLKDDVKDFYCNFTFEDDQKILDVIVQSAMKNYVQTRPSTYHINSININHPPHQIYLRSIYLIAFNYLFLNIKSFSEHIQNEKINRFLSKSVFAERFSNMICSYSMYSYVTLRIDRQKGHNYRNGLDQNEENSMIAQFTRDYLQNPYLFRNESTPFKVIYINEKGIDAGGLMRDFITEMICDINTPKVGLFIQTPNGRNHEGNYQECIVPVPAPEIRRSNKYYRAIGGLIAIAVRTGMKQSDLVFPPLFWKFITSGEINIDDIYEIDKSYKDIVSRLTHEATQMTDDEFENLMSKTTILNTRGTPISIDIDYSRSNINIFVTICNQARVDELAHPLKKIRKGFWENLNIEVPSFVTPSLIEYMACGNRIISVEDLRQNTSFVNVPDDQVDYFWDVVSRLDNNERKKLVHFATGLNTINDHNEIKIDCNGDEKDVLLPTASTCFFTLHLPPFSSADKMFNAFKIAINETGTFENS